MVKLKRKINGHRGGSKGYVDWATVQLKMEAGMKPGTLHPCTFKGVGKATGEKTNLVKHIDDTAMTGKGDDLKKLYGILDQHMSIRKTGELGFDKAGHEKDW